MARPARKCKICGVNMIYTRGRCRHCNVTYGLSVLFDKLCDEYRRAGFAVNTANYIYHRQKRSHDYDSNPGLSILASQIGFIELCFSKSYPAEILYDLTVGMLPFRSGEVSVFGVHGFTFPVEVRSSDGAAEIEKAVRSSIGKLARWVNRMERTGVIAVWKLKGIM